MKFVLALGLLAVVLPWSNGLKDCITIKKHISISEEFLRQGKFYIPFHSDCTNCEKGDPKWRPFEGRTAPKSLCYKLSGDMDKKPFSADFECTYSAAGKGGCILLPGKSHNKPFAGDMVLTKTDNKTYMAGTTCIFGEDQFFWVATVEDMSGDKKLKKKMLKHFKDIGFENPKLVDKDGPLVLKSLEYHKDKC